LGERGRTGGGRGGNLGGQLIQLWIDVKQTKKKEKLWETTRTGILKGQQEKFRPFERQGHFGGRKEGKKDHL